MNKKIYFKEVGEIIEANKTNDLVVKADYELLYLVVTNQNKNVDGGFLADKIVNSFSNTLFTQVMVSWEFLQSEVGRALIKAKFEVSNDIYLVTDLVDITGYTRQYIRKAEKEGKIISEKRKGTIMFREIEVNRFLKLKNKPNLLENQKSFVYEDAKETLINGGFGREEEYK